MSFKRGRRGYLPRAPKA